jgi:hypothetical protein
LFFTDQGVAYVCNENAHCEFRGLWYDDHRKWSQIGRLRYCLPHSESDLRGAQKLLQEYCKRNLTSDHDALNTILGALSILDESDPPVHHLWGVPFSPESGHVRNMDVGLLWYHDSSNHKAPCRRLPDFPSWSPIGWKGVLSFEEQSISVSAQLKVEIWRGGAYHDLFAPLVAHEDLHDLSSTDESKILRVVGHTLPFKLRHITQRPNQTDDSKYQFVRSNNT